MKERCGECKDYRPIGGSEKGRCVAWQALGFWTEVQWDEAPLENLRQQSRIAYWLARRIYWFNDSVCFRPNEAAKRASFKS